MYSYPIRTGLGRSTEGVKIALGGVQVGRLGVAGSCLGLACWALDQAVEYARVRKALDRPIGELQSVQNMLADCALDDGDRERMINIVAEMIDPSVRNSRIGDSTSGALTPSR